MALYEVTILSKQKNTADLSEGLKVAMVKSDEWRPGRLFQALGPATAKAR